MFIKVQTRPVFFLARQTIENVYHIKLIHGEYYDVVFIVGTMQVKIRNIPFVPIEDMIAFKDIDGITSILNSYFTQSEQEQFNRSLIKNFTLENVMNYLTILNAGKLLEYMDVDSFGLKLWDGTYFDTGSF